MRATDLAAEEVHHPTDLVLHETAGQMETSGYQIGEMGTEEKTLTLTYLPQVDERRGREVVLPLATVDARAAPSSEAGTTPTPADQDLLLDDSLRDVKSAQGHPQGDVLDLHMAVDLSLRQ